MLTPWVNDTRAPVTFSSFARLLRSFINVAERQRLELHLKTSYHKDPNPSMLVFEDVLFTPEQWCKVLLTYLDWKEHKFTTFQIIDVVNHLYPNELNTDAPSCQINDKLLPRTPESS